MATLPQQAPGPGPTAQALPSYLSYSPVDTNVIQYTSTLTQVVYDPQGNFGPYVTTNLVQGTTTSIDYSIVQVPLLYTGPFPAPDLGTLYTTPGQSLPSATSAAPTSATVGSSASNASPTQTAAPSSAATNTAGTATSTQEGSVTAESAPTITPTSTVPPDSSASSLSAAPTTAPSSTVSPSSSTATNPGSSTSTTSGESSATTTGVPNPNVRAAKDLSGGQIAGIVIGAFFALLLLLLLLLCCLRRRRKKRQQQKVLAAATGGGGAGGSSRAGGGARGNYAAIGAGAAAAGLGASGAAAAGRRGSLGSDDWEEDHLTGSGAGSGFFVVGGRRLGPDRRASMASRRSRASAGGGGRYTAANVAPASAQNAAKTTGLASLAAAGAGFLGAAFGLGKKKKKNRVEIEEEQPLSDEDLGDGSMAERRGLMPYHDSPGSGYGSGREMREASPQVLGPAAALLGAAGAGGAAAAYGANRGHGSEAGFPQRSQYMPGYGGASMSRPPSSAFSGSGASSSGPGSSSNATGVTSSSHTQRAGGPSAMSSSNSTGGFTTSGSGASLPPPPRAPRSSPQSSVQTYGNLNPASSATPFSSPATGTDANTSALTGQNPRFSADTTDSATSATGGLNPALLGIGAGALGGLGALAAGHRESDGSTYSRHNLTLSSDMRGSHVSEMSAEELSHLRSTDPERYSRFISTGSTLLGPDYQPSPDLDADSKDPSGSTNASPFQAGTMGTGTTAFQRTRLATIRSVGEFGEKGDSSGPVTQSTGSRTTSSQAFTSMHAASAASGSLGASSGSRHVTSPLPVYEPQQLQAGETLPHYTFHDQPATSMRHSDTELIQSTVSEGQGRFVTPPDSPRNTLGGAMSLRSAERPSSEAHRYADASDSDFGEAAGLENVQGDQHGTELAERGVASAGILGGVAAGWRRLTMGQYAWIPGASSSRGHQNSSFEDSSGDLIDVEGRFSHDQGQRPSEDSSRLIHQRRASRLDTSDAGLAPDVRSERASVYGPSALGHNTSRSSPIAHFSSKEASGSSGEQAKNVGGDTSQSHLPEAAALAAGAAAVSQRQRSYPSLSSQHSSARSRAGGYAASHSNSSMSGRRTASDSTGLDSLSAIAQLSSRSTGSASTRSGYRSSSRGGRSHRSEASLGSGASTGAASYSPSGVLSRGNTTSTRGLADDSALTGSATYYASRSSGEASSRMADAEDAGMTEADLTSSRATQGGSSSLERRKRPRSASVDGLSRLDSLREVREASDPFGDAEAVPDVPPIIPPAGGHYPSESLGAAVSRSVARDVRQQPSSPAEDGVGDDSGSNYLRSQPMPQRSRIRSLQPGTSAPAPTALAPSLSTPSLNSFSRVELGHSESQPGMPSTGSGSLSGIPASASWRPSPRVASAAQRAAEAQAALLQTQEAGNFGGPTPPRSQAASPTAAEARASAGASYNWADLDTTFRQPDRRYASADLEHAEGDTSATQEDPDRSNKSFEWPKFLRF
ncbi:uncharacterized protein UTRI_01395_B [Ustilago trichophora]|uniref:Uncharacterized protein n=1 Tax=Ustilago trichophora TaxID=86804 RepID=A0A5C3E478_9BASI|nr:uncharacterized protein UTRI_01395_B [Ustilago trichophora]